jgi:hypothetical protein
MALRNPLFPLTVAVKVAVSPELMVVGLTKAEHSNFAAAAELVIGTMVNNAKAHVASRPRPHRGPPPDPSTGGAHWAPDFFDCLISTPS